MSKSKTKSVKKKQQGRTPYEKMLYMELEGKWKDSSSVENEARWWIESKMRSRVVKATCELKDEARERSGWNQNSSDEYFGQVACSQGGPCRSMARLGMYTATALWIRDIIEIQGDDKKIQKLLELEDSDIVQRVNLPQSEIPCMDTGHEDGPEDINALARIIYNRLSENYWRYNGDDEKRYGPTWGLYTELISMLDQNAVQMAKKMYTDQFWAYARSGMKLVRGFDNYKRKPEPPDKSTPGMVRKFDYSISPGRSNMRSAIMCEEGKFICISYFDWYLSHVGAYMDQIIDWSLKEIGVEITGNDFDPGTVTDGIYTDPFTMMAGYIFLEDADSNLVFAKGISQPLLALYADMFPWSVLSRSGIENKQKLPEYITGTNNGYIRNIRHTIEGTETYLSTAQIIYTGTGHIIMPSYMNDSVKAIKDSRSPRETLAGIYKLAVKDISNPKEIYKKYTEERKDREINEAITGAEAKGRSSADKEVERLERELADARKQVTEIDHQLKSIQSDLEASEKANEEEKAELYDLREVVFQSLDGELPDDEEEDVSDRFPYEAKKKIVIYGGHDTWRKGIKSKIPNVTLAPRNESANLQLVRNADILWIQINAISHPLYHSVYDCAKNAGVPIRVFASAGVNTCAMKIIESDSDN